MNKFLTIIIIFFSAQLNAQNTLKGVISDKETGETLIGTSIYIPELQLGTSSNNYGWFSVTVPSGNYQMKISYIGYVSENIPVTYTNHSSFEGLSIKLKPAPLLWRKKP